MTIKQQQQPIQSEPKESKTYIYIISKEKQSSKGNSAMKLGKIKNCISIKYSSTPKSFINAYTIVVILLILFIFQGVAFQHEDEKEIINKQDLKDPPGHNSQQVDLENQNHYNQKLSEPQSDDVIQKEQQANDNSKLQGDISQEDNSNQKQATQNLQDKNVQKEQNLEIVDEKQDQQSQKKQEEAQQQPQVEQIIDQQQQEKGSQLTQKQGEIEEQGKKQQQNKQQRSKLDEDEQQQQGQIQNERGIKKQQRKQANANDKQSQINNLNNNQSQVRKPKQREQVQIPKIKPKSSVQMQYPQFQALSSFLSPLLPLSVVLSKIFNYLPNLIPSISYLLPSSVLLNLYSSWVKKTTQFIFPFALSCTRLYTILLDTQPVKSKPKKVYYPINYANLYGGAKIIMKSSQKIKSVNSLLEDGADKYMYTEEEFPIKIIIGLNQQVALQSIIVQSYEMYSNILKQFKVQGKFAMEDKKWVYLGTFKAQNMFGDQQFFIEKKIVRYIKFTLLSSYGKWSYFTLTQIKIRGKGLFADAISSSAPSPSVQNLQPQQPQQSQSHKESQIRDKADTCPNTLKPSTSEPHESNMILSLIQQLTTVSHNNREQSQQIQSLTRQYQDIKNILSMKVQQNALYAQLLSQYKTDSNRNYYVMGISLLLSFVMLFAMVCMCLLRRREMLGSAFNGTVNSFSIKKSSSIH